MTSWLESEEKKKQEADDQIHDQIHKQELYTTKLDNHLEKFNNLCLRVSKIRKLDIYPRKIISGRFKIYSEKVNDSDFIDAYWCYGAHMLEFYYTQPEKYSFDLSIIEIEQKVNSDDGKYCKRLLYKKEITLDDLINWNEEEMQLFFEWFLQISDSAYVNNSYTKSIYWENIFVHYLRFLSLPIDHLPGNKNIPAIFNIELTLPTLFKELEIEKNKLSEIDNWSLFRTQSQKDKQLNEQRIKFKNIQNKILYLKLERLNPYHSVFTLRHALGLDR